MERISPFILRTSGEGRLVCFAVAVAVLFRNGSDKNWFRTHFSVSFPSCKRKKRFGVPVPSNFSEPAAAFAGSNSYGPLSKNRVNRSVPVPYHVYDGPKSYPIRTNNFIV